MTLISVFGVPAAGRWRLGRRIPREAVPPAASVPGGRPGPSPANGQSSTRRRRRALAITDTELNVIAALAIIGLSRMPAKG